MLRWRPTALAAAGAGLLIAAMTMPTVAAGPSTYQQVNLVSDVSGLAKIMDPHLVNPWGMSFGPTTPVWVSDEGTGVTTLYAGTSRSNVSIVPLVVNLPAGHATGQVFNGSSAFVVGSGANKGAALFIFATLTGRIIGWNPGVPPPPPSTQGQVAVVMPHSAFTGLAIGKVGTSNRLYAANFAKRRINVWNGKWMPVVRRGAFRDPNLPAGYSPFNIQNLGGHLFVEYAKVNPANGRDQAGRGLGFVDEYTMRGRLMRRIASHGPLNAPWGVAIAPAHGFGKFNGDLLVGNFGNGRISAYNLRTRHFDGQLRRHDGTRIRIEGLWALMFGNGTAGTPRQLLFTAGIGDEQHGLFGFIRVHQ
jgi:uncharacterized protein (TIGR03118 family)